MTAEEEARFHETILHCVADGVFTVDEHWRITSFNRAAERITGVPAEQAIGRRCSEVFHANICENGCAIRKTRDTGREVIDAPARILNSRGKSVPISVSAAELRDRTGKRLGAVETFRDLSAIEQLRREIGRQYTFEDIVGKSPAFRKIFALLPDVAESDSTVLIEGPSGSGKELLARAIHNLSSRRKKPYVVVNCGAMPANLVESELFGYVRGAFTDAKNDKPGRVALAEGGTIFFDEIGEMPPETQVKVLRLLQEREYEPLGAVKPRKADVRVVAATNRKLLDLVGLGRFRDDLYFRLAVIKIAIPPLRERREDIPYLVEHFIQRFNIKRNKQIAGATPAAMALFLRYDYAGNVRELENAIEHAFVLCRDSWIDVAHLPEEMRKRASAARRELEQPKAPLLEAERQTLAGALREHGGSVGKAAAALGLSRTTLWRKMRKHGLEAKAAE